MNLCILPVFVALTVAAAVPQPPPPPAAELPVPVPAGFDMRQGAVRPELDAAWKKLPVVEQVKLAQSEENAKTFLLGVDSYMQDHDDTYPPMSSIGQARYAVLPYIKAEANYDHTAADKSFRANPQLSNIKLFKVDDPASTVAIYSVAPDRFDYRTVGFADGHAEILSVAEWKQLKSGTFKP